MRTLSRPHAAAGLALAGLAACLGLLPGCGGQAPEELVPARRGDLDVVLRLQGLLRPVKEQTIRCPRWGEVRRMAANGSRVHAGEIVLELDSEDVENSIRDSQAEVAVRTAELRQVEQEVEKSVRGAKMRHSAAGQAAELERFRLSELKAQPTPRELTDAQARLKLAEQLVVAGKESMALLRELCASGYAPQDEVRTAESDLAAAEAELAAAKAGLATVTAGPTASELQQAELSVRQAELAEQAAEKRIQIVKEWSEGKLARFQRALEREQEKLDELQRRLAEHRVAAPGDGVVLYAPRPWGGGWQPGQHVWQGATIMSIPNLSRMKLIIQVPANSVRRLESLGHAPARVRPLALPDKVFPASLTRISTVGRDEFEQLDPSTSGKLGRAERQVFEAELELSEEDLRLKPGFAADAEVILRQVKGAIIVPRVALVEAPRPRDEGNDGSGPNGSATSDAPSEATVYVSVRGGFEPRSVRVVAVNSLEAAVEGPLSEGDLLYPGAPPGLAAPAAPARGPDHDGPDGAGAFPRPSPERVKPQRRQP